MPKIPDFKHARQGRCRGSGSHSRDCVEFWWPHIHQPTTPRHSFCLAGFAPGWPPGGASLNRKVGTQPSLSSSKPPGPCAAPWPGGLSRQGLFAHGVPNCPKPAPGDCDLENSEGFNRTEKKPRSRRTAKGGANDAMRRLAAFRYGPAIRIRGWAKFEQCLLGEVVTARPGKPPRNSFVF